MNIFTKIISASLSPNAEADDVWEAAIALLTPWRWLAGRHEADVRAWFGRTFPQFETVTCNSGRSALYLICKAFGIESGDEVLVQSFTCVAVPNSILWNGAIPVYVDIDRTLNFDVSDAEKKISSKTRALVIQHTLGLPADLNRITKFAKKHKLLLIEDCAHAIGAEYNGKPIGSYGDASFFSFGRDKVISSVFGGAAMIRKSHKKAVSALRRLHDELPMPARFWIFQQVVHPVLFAVILPLYVSGIGKAMLIVFQKLSLLSLPVYASEKRGKQPAGFPSAYPDVLARLILRQFTKLDRFNRHRRKIAALYMNALKGSTSVTLLSYPKESVFLRFPMLVKNPDILLKKAKSNGILLGNWYHNVIDPIGVDFAAVGYKIGSCPAAERTAECIINLPTNITHKEAERILGLFA